MPPINGSAATLAGDTRTPQVGVKQKTLVPWQRGNMQTSETGGNNLGIHFGGGTGGGSIFFCCPLHLLVLVVPYLAWSKWKLTLSMVGLYQTFLLSSLGAYIMAKLYRRRCTCASNPTVCFEMRRSTVVPVLWALLLPATSPRYFVLPIPHNSRCRHFYTEYSQRTSHTVRVKE